MDRNSYIEELERMQADALAEQFYDKVKRETEEDRKECGFFEKVLLDQLCIHPPANKDEKKDFIKDVNELCLKMREEYRPTNEALEALAEKMAPITMYSKEEVKQEILKCIDQFDKVKQNKRIEKAIKDLANAGTYTNPLEQYSTTQLKEELRRRKNDKSKEQRR